MISVSPSSSFAWSAPRTFLTPSSTASSDSSWQRYLRWRSAIWFALSRGRLRISGRLVGAAADAAELQRGRRLRQAGRDPNPPLLSANRIADLQRKYRCQLESLLAVDDGVKRSLGALQAKGELGDTLIIYTSDNGYFNGEHRIPAHKARVYEESIRVPLAMRGPGSRRGEHQPADGQRRPGTDDRSDGDGGHPGLVIDGRSLFRWQGIRRWAPIASC